jgi:hypothetical protein
VSRGLIRERTCSLSRGSIEGLSLFLRHLSPADSRASAVVLYLHGLCFPSALSHRFDLFVKVPCNLTEFQEMDLSTSITRD